MKGHLVLLIALCATSVVNGATSTCKKVPLYKACGGRSGAPKGVIGKDAQWNGYCCDGDSRRVKCMRQSEWYWQCLPVTNAKSPKATPASPKQTRPASPKQTRPASPKRTPASPKANPASPKKSSASPLPKKSPHKPGCTTVAVWKQCGGLSQAPKGVTGVEGTWAGYCCAAKTSCVRVNKYYYQCQPPPAPKASPALKKSPAPALCNTGYELVAGKCQLCKENYYSRKNSNVCLPCPAGSEGTDDSSRAGCVPCPAGSYNDKPGDSCEPCVLPSGAVTPAGAKTCP